MHKDYCVRSEAESVQVSTFFANRGPMEGRDPLLWCQKSSSSVQSHNPITAELQYLSENKEFKLDSCWSVEATVFMTHVGPLRRS